ncbi:MAG: hypothetical protein DCC75_01200 [Proteobacteria bacterium]|nr:MAG: hypothetical protein DCC75_01200 [Pseudomonadota bacterium]
MPHCILEISSNVHDPFDQAKFFSVLHKIVSAGGEIALEKIKSRVVWQESYHIGDGDSKNAFIYLQISLLSGRPLELRNLIARQAIELLREFFPQAISDLKCSVTVEIREIDRTTHISLKEILES